MPALLAAYHLGDFHYEHLFHVLKGAFKSRVVPTKDFISISLRKSSDPRHMQNVLDNERHVESVSHHGDFFEFYPLSPRSVRTQANSHPKWYQAIAEKDIVCTKPLGDLYSFVASDPSISVYYLKGGSIIGIRTCSTLATSQLSESDFHEDVYRNLRADGIEIDDAWACLRAIYPRLHPMEDIALVDVFNQTMSALAEARIRVPQCTSHRCSSRPVERLSFHRKKALAAYKGGFQIPDLHPGNVLFNPSTEEPAAPYQAKPN